MSHWTKAKVQIKDLGVLERAARNLGVSIDFTKTTMKSRYAGNRATVGVIGSGEATAGVVKEADGTYTLLIDNYANTLVSKVGMDCSKLTQEYAKLIVEDQIMMMGGCITGQEVKNGEVYLTVSL